jgi:hypothetical protein
MLEKEGRSLDPVPQSQSGDGRLAG